MSKRSNSRKRVAQLVALCAILGLLFAVAAPAMIFLGASQQAAQHNNTVQETEEVITEEVINELLESLETETSEENTEPSEELVEDTPNEETETTETPE